MKVYLDNASTTKIDPLVLKAMLLYLKEDYGNASSIHSWGQKTREAIETARQQVADFLHCQAQEVIFTGSATQSDNLAILGVVKATKISKPHIITSQIEHLAVLETCYYLQKNNLAKITFLPAYKDGIVKVSDIKKAIQKNTCLVSIMYANNEIGTIQPIAEIGKLLKNKDIYFHSDAVQAVNYLNCDVQKLGVDLLTLSAHKIYGPKAVGVLYVKNNTKIEPITFGGHQEMGLNAGTENVPNIVGLAKAIGIIKQSPKVKELRDILEKGIFSKIPNVKLNGSKTNRLPNNVNLSFAGAEGEAIVMALDQQGIAVSTGSACSSGSLEQSHVLKAMGVKSHGSVRFTLGKYNTKEEISYVLDVLPKVIERLRQISGR